VAVAQDQGRGAKGISGAGKRPEMMANGKWQATSAANYRLPGTTTATSQRNDIFKLLLYLHLSQVQKKEEKGCTMR